MENNELHYEQIIGALEVEANRLGLDTKLKQDLHHIRAWLVDLIHQLLKERQIKNDEYISETLKIYKRFKEFASVDYPFWIFTLNHDVIVEILASHFNINIRTGLYNKGNSVPLREQSSNGETRISFLEFDIANFDKEPLNFYNNINDRGINLFKLHGSLDLFVSDDKKKYLKINFDGCTNHYQVIERLRTTTELLEDFSPVRCTNMIPFKDDNGVIQFLEKSILTGSHKFEGVPGQIIPDDILQKFKSHINYISELYVVGYSFGDIHINQIFRKWLTMKPYHKMVIVDPYRDTLPEEFKIYFRQCDIKQQNFIEFLAEETGDRLTKKEKQLLNTRKKYRELMSI